MRFPPQIFTIALAGLILASQLISCRALDDDSRFAVQNIGSWIFVRDTASPNPFLARVGPEGTLTEHWNQSIGISDADLSDFFVNDRWGWISSAPKQEVYKVDMAAGTILQTYKTEGFSPHFVASGLKYLLLSDSSAGRISFVNIKKGDVYITGSNLPPHQALYNGGKFYLKQGCCTVGIINESALTQYAELQVDFPIRAMRFDTERNLVIFFRDTSSQQTLASTIDSNGDVLVRDNEPTNFSLIEYSPWFNQVYGSEFLGRMRLRDSILSTSEDPQPISTSVSWFSTDFFESKVFFQSQDSLTRFDLQTYQPLQTFHFPYSPVKAYHFLGHKAE